MPGLTTARCDDRRNPGTTPVSRRSGNRPVCRRAPRRRTSGAPAADLLMDLAGSDRQGAGPVQDADFAGQLVMRPQVAVELRAVALLDYQHAARAVECAGEH